MADLMKRCAVTGANGYIGSRISASFAQNGWLVYELRHDLIRGMPGDQFKIPYSLGMDLDEEVLKAVDVLIHCAYDFRPIRWSEIFRVNVEGSVKLLEAAKASGVKKLIFISTMAAFDDCKSLYGKAKMEIEKQTKDICSAVIRPGLVFGKHAGGMLGALSRIVTISKIVPMLGRGEQQLFLVHEADLCLLVRKCAEMEESLSQPVLAASDRGRTLKSIIGMLGEMKRKRLVLLPIPWQLIWIGLRVLEEMRIRVGLRSDSVISLINQDQNPDFRNTKKLGVQFREFSPQAMVV